MIIIQMSGGLGNQMFQYALYLKLKKLGHDVKFDDRTEYDRPEVRPIQLSAFGIRYPAATHDEVIDITDGSMKLRDRIRRRLTGRKTAEYAENGTCYDPLVMNRDPAYLVGNFQSERYFADIEGEVRKAFQFDPEIISDEIKEWEKRITADDAAAIHIRRGDYLNAKDVYGDICTDEYYDAAIDVILKKHPDTVFYLFSNDHEWSDMFMGRHKDIPMHSVKCSTEYTGYLDMYLMSKCKGHIIANSSFSWWGAWLCSDSQKEVIAPKVWLNNGKCADIHTDDMILIDKGGIIFDKESEDV